MAHAHKVLDGSRRLFENSSLGLLQIDETRGSTLSTEICTEASSRRRVAVCQTADKSTGTSVADILDYDAGEPRAPCLGTYHVSVAHWSVVIHDSTSAQHMSRPVSFDCRTARHKHHLCDRMVIVCEQVSGCPCVSFSEMCSLSLFRCPRCSFPCSRVPRSSASSPRAVSGGHTGPTSRDIVGT